MIVAQIGAISEAYSHVVKDVDAASSNASFKLDSVFASQPEKGKEAEVRKQGQESLKLSRDAQAMKTSLDKTKQSALNLECMYLEFSQKQLGNLSFGVIGALERAALSSNNYWRSDTVGPYDTPTTVTVSLQQKKIVAPDPLASPRFQPSSSQACSKELLTKNDFVGAMYSVPQAAGEGSKPSSTNANAPAAAKDSSKAEDSGFEIPKKVVLHFGTARFITAAGIAFGVAGNPQYERVSGLPRTPNGAPTSQTFTSVVGATSDSSFRVVPSLFLHTHLLQTWKAEGMYFTFAVGPHFDNKGVTPEGLIGMSHSLVEQRLFFTLGAYIGQQQRLKNGLYLGQDISSLQGSLPIDKVTVVRFGFGFSYRFNLGSASGQQKDTKADTGTQGTAQK